MTIREIALEIPHLTIDERLSLLSIIAESLRKDSKRPTRRSKASANSATPITDMLTGIISLDAQSDGALNDEYADYLEKKYS